MGSFFFMYCGNHLKALKIPACGHWLKFPLAPFATGKCSWHLCDRFPNCFSHHLGHFRCSAALVKNCTNLYFLGQILMPYNLWSTFISIELNLCFFLVVSELFSKDLPSSLQLVFSSLGKKEICLTLSVLFPPPPPRIPCNWKIFLCWFRILWLIHDLPRTLLIQTWDLVTSLCL